ncbi:MAG: amino acid adenylation domain-containing protein, partial [Chloroflexi bacterium]|nr:amino acid adenylation domain-containing protein [Chloroflexota bacterium]
VQALIAQPFDLAHGPLLRATLFERNSAEHILVLVIHHSVFDGWSQGVLLRELSLVYSAQAQGAAVALPDLPVQYADYAVWQRAWLQGAVLDQQLGYWRQQLAGVTPLELPTDYPRPPLSDQRGAVHSFALPAALGAALQRVSQQLGATLFMTLLAAWQTLLMRYSGQTDIAIGTPIAGRTRPELEGLIGFFVNTLVLRTDLSGRVPSGCSFAELVARVRATALDAYAHQELPFEQIVEAVQPERDLSRSPLFQVMFTLQNTPRTTIDLPDLRLEPVVLEHHTSKFDLTLTVSETPGVLVGALEYRTELFAAQTIERIADHFQTLLAAVVADPQQPIDRLPLLSDVERRQLLFDWNTAAADFPSDRCLHDLVAEQAQRTPDAVAVVCGQQQLTYAELDQRANQLAHHLQALGVQPETRVALCVMPSVEVVITLLAILKAGGCYLPLDPSYPADRLGFMVQDSQAQVVITQTQLRDRVQFEVAHVVYLDDDWPLIAQLPTIAPVSNVSSANLAYMIYTSGSTGQPKGVLLSHRNAVNNLWWRQTTWPLDATDRMLQSFSISFDPSVWNIFWPLLAGARVVLVGVGEHADSGALVRLLRDHQITAFGATPTLHAVLLEEPAIIACTDVRYVVSGGEALPASLQRRFFERLNAILCNCYGPTEATIDTTFWVCSPDDDSQPAPIGRPVPNLEVYILDAQLQPVPVGVPGELYIGGVGLSRGYHNRPALTAERFVPNPFSQTPGSRLYRTGDLVRYRADGAIVFMGRVDQQIKLRGFRIELEEIEAALRQHESVREAAVVIRDARLLAYVVEKNLEPRTQNLDGEQENKEQSSTIDLPSPVATGEGPGVRATAEGLRAFLAAHLPEYMVPSAVMVLDTLPLLPNGKIDRKALPAPEIIEEAAQEFVAPRTPTEELIASVWAHVLGRERIGIHDNFFTLGGHSLLATQVVSRLRQVLNVDLPLRALFEAPTVAGLAVQLAQASGADVLPLVAVPRDGQALPLSFAQQRLWFLDQLQPGNAAYHIPLVVRMYGTLDLPALAQSLRALVARHEVLRTTFALGPDGQPVQVINPAAD